MRGTYLQIAASNLCSCLVATPARADHRPNALLKTLCYIETTGRMHAAGIQGCHTPTKRHKARGTRPRRRSCLL